MKELINYSGQTQFGREKLQLVGCDERAIVCASMKNITERLGQASLGIVLAMPNEQFQMGLRGFAKAKILAQVCDVRGVLPVDFEQMQSELTKPWGQKQILAPMMWQADRIISATQSKSGEIKIGLAQSEFDQMAMQLAVQMVGTSNCWLDPAGCVFAKDRRVLVESASTRLSDFSCDQLPFGWMETNLKAGERMLFCDSLHAERTGISLAAQRGISLDGATMYVSKFPCRQCSLNAIEAGIKRVVFEKDSYGIAEAGDLYRSHQISVERIVS